MAAGNKIIGSFNRYTWREVQGSIHFQHVICYIYFQEWVYVYLRSILILQIIKTSKLNCIHMCVFFEKFLPSRHWKVINLFFKLFLDRISVYLVGQASKHLSIFVFLFEHRLSGHVFEAFLSPGNSLIVIRMKEMRLCGEVENASKEWDFRTVF